MRLAWIAVLLLCIAQLVRTPVNLDLSGFLPAHAEPAQRILIDQMREGVGGRLVLLAISGDTAEARARLSQALAARMSRDGHFSLVANGEPLPPAQLEWLMRHRYLLTPELSAASFTTDALRRSLESGLQLLASPLGSTIKDWLPRDPTGATLSLLDSLAGRNPPPHLHGVWVSRDGERAVLLAYARAAGTDALAQERALDSASQAFASIRQEAGASSRAQLEMTGPAVFATESRHQIEREAHRVTGLSILFVTAILWLAYRAWKPVAFSLVPLVTGLAVGAAAVGAWFGSIHGITLAFGAILIGEAVDYPAYLFTHRMPGEALATTAQRIRRALALAILTSALGALAMLLSDLEGLRQLGVLTAAGALAAGFATHWILPALGPGEYRVPRLPSLPRPPAWAAVVLLAGAVLVVARADGVWDDDLSNLSPVAPERLAQDRALRDELGAPDVRFILTFTAASADAALASTERHRPWLDRLVASGAITGYALAAQTLPSQATQAARRAMLPDAETAARNLQRALDGLPFRPSGFAPFLEELERSRTLPSIERADLEGTPWASRVDALLAPAHGQWVALAPLSGIADPVRLTHAVAAYGQPGIALLDIKGDTESLLRNAREQAVLLMLGGIATIAALLWIGLRHPAGAARALAPVLAAMLTTVAAILLIEGRLNLFHLVSLLLVLGIGLNYALFFQRQPETPDVAKRAATAIGICGLTSITAFACLTFSSIPVLRAIGLTVLLGTLFSLFYATARPGRRAPADHR